MPQYANALITLAIGAALLVPLLYQAKKWNVGSNKSRSFLELANDVKPEDIRFSSWTNNLIVGKNEIPYPVYNDLTEIDTIFKKWLVNMLKTRTPSVRKKGRIGYVKGDLPFKKAYSLVTIVWLVGAVVLLVSLALEDAFLPSLSQHQKKFLYSLFLFIVSTFNLSYLRLFHGWTSLGNQLVIGKWVFHISIPWSEIAAVDVGFMQGKFLNNRRKAGFIMVVEHGSKKLVFHDAHLGNLLLLYDVIVANRPDLKIT